MYDWYTEQWSLFALTVHGTFMTDYPEMSQINNFYTSAYEAYIRPVYGPK
jgi:hypothetical protein